MKKVNFITCIVSFLLPSVTIHAAPIPSGSGTGDLLTIKGGSRHLCIYGRSVNNVFYASVNWSTLDSCAKSRAPKFTFSVLGQVMTKIYSKWWCLTAPNNKYVTSSYDYVALLPCSIFDKKQEWRYNPTTDGLVTAKDGYELRERNWTLAISAYPGRLNKFSFNFPNYRNWLKDDTKVRSGLTFPMPISWKHKNTEHYISESSYYNPDTKHIFMVNSQNPAQWLCLSSRQAKKGGTTWDWVDYVDCGSESMIDELSWDVDSFTPNDKSYNGVIISDNKGNILRVSSQGSSSGSPYTVTPNYSKKDTSDFTTSIFRTKEHLKQYLQLESANLGKTLPKCPAPGQNNQRPITPRSLPRNFNIENWWERIYAIVSQPGDDESGIGTCGTCFMQALEAVREMYLHGNQPPQPNQPGIFFPLDRQTNLIEYIRSHDANRYRRAQRLTQLYQANMDTNAGWEARQQAGLTQASAEIFLPNYEIITTSSDLIPQGQDPGSQEARRQLFEGLWRGFDTSPQGTIWIVTYTFQDRSGREHGHAVMMMRTQYGLQLFDANIYREHGGTISLEEYRTQSRNVIRGGRGLENQLLLYIGAPHLGVRTLRLLDAHRVENRAQPPGGPLAATSSFGDCNSSTSSTGAQTGGLGSGRLPTGNDLNQCSASGGKCYLQ